MKIKFKGPYSEVIKIFATISLIVVLVFVVTFGVVDALMYHKCKSYGEVTGYETKYAHLDSCYIKDIYGDWKKYHL